MAVTVFFAGLAALISPIPAAGAAAMAGGLSLLILALTPYRDVRVLDVAQRLWRKVVGGPNERSRINLAAINAPAVRSGIIEGLDASWDADLLPFRDDAGDLWDILGAAFEQTGFWGSGSGRAGFTKVVRHAAWPDSSGETDDAQTLATGALEDFVAKGLRRVRTTGVRR